MEQSLGNAPDQQPGEGRMAPGAHDDHVGALVSAKSAILWAAPDGLVATIWSLAFAPCSTRSATWCSVFASISFSLPCSCRGFELAADAWYSTSARREARRQRPPTAFWRREAPGQRPRSHRWRTQPS